MPPNDLMTDDLRAKALRIELLVLDVDGVLTDGNLWYSNMGEELKGFHVRDGLGLKLWQQAGGRAAILSGRESKAVTRRAKELGLHPIIQRCDDKAAGLAKLLAEAKVPANQACGMGDDLPDLPFLSGCGLALTVADAAVEVRMMADHVTTTVGGRGAVREAVEWLLKLRGQWTELVETFQVSG